MNPKHRRFVAEYLRDLNATQAARRAGYSQKTARAIGSRLLTNVDIAGAITNAEDARAARTNITVDGVVNAIAAIAHPVDEHIEVKDRLKALELLGRHLGMFKETHEHTGKGGGPIHSTTRVVFGGRYRPDGTHAAQG